MPGLDETENEFRWRLNDPGKYDQFRHKEIDTGVSIIYGKLKGQNKWEAQSLRFDKEKFDKEQARKWIKDHEGGFTESGELDYALPKTYDIDNVEIFSVGTWNGDKYTDDDLNVIVQSFNETKEHMRPYLKLGHDKSQKLAQTDGYPAVGWIDSLKKIGSKIVANFKHIPKKVYDLITAKAYRRVSCEIFFNIRVMNKRYGKMLKAVSLLGADTPAVSNLNDIIALYTLDNELANDDQSDQSVHYEFDNPDYDKQKYYKEDDKMSKEIIDGLMKDKEVLTKQLDEANAKAEQLQKEKADAEAGKAEAEAKIEEANKAKDALVEDNKKLDEEVKKHTLQTIRAEVNATLDKLISEQHIIPAQKEGFFTLLFELKTAPGEIKKYKVGEEEKSMYDIVLGIVQAHKYTANLGGASTLGDTASNDDRSNLAEKAKQYAKEHNVDYKTALFEISK